MKTLFLMRHGKSSWADAGMKDFDRPLNERGLKDVPDMAKKMMDQQELPALIVSSPAVRAKTTAMLFAYKAGLDTDAIVFNPGIYEATLDQLQKIINRFDDRYESIMMVGHNPTFTHALPYFTGQFLDNLPTSGIMKMEFEVPSWSRIKERSGTYCLIDYPKNPSH